MDYGGIVIAGNLYQIVDVKVHGDGDVHAVVQAAVAWFTASDPKQTKYLILDKIEAYHHNGWWEITKANWHYSPWVMNIHHPSYEFPYWLKLERIA